VPAAPSASRCLLSATRPPPSAVRLPALAAVLLTLAGVAGAGAPPTEELRELRARIETLKQDLARTEGTRTEAADALKESEQAISEANRRLLELGTGMKHLESELGGLRERLAALEKATTKEQSAAARVIVQQYMAGPVDRWLLVLDRRDPNEIARALVYQGYVARARAGLVTRLRADRERLAALAAEALERTRALADIQSEHLVEKKRLEAEKAKRREVLAQVSRQIAGQRREIGSLERDEKRLAQLVASLGKLLGSRKPAVRGPTNERLPDASQDGVPFQRLKGRLVLPVRGELAGRFGSPRSDSGLSWKGLFIQAAGGEAVKAVAAGRVVFADWLRGFGNLLILDHGEGYMSLYGNNESLVRRVGDGVRGGDTVATVGASGGNPETGLYFELRHQGKPFDPLGWVTLR